MCAARQRIGARALFAGYAAAPVARDARRARRPLRETPVARDAPRARRPSREPAAPGGRPTTSTPPRASACASITARSRPAPPHSTRRRAPRISGRPASVTSPLSRAGRRHPTGSPRGRPVNPAQDRLGAQLAGPSRPCACPPAPRLHDPRRPVPRRPVLHRPILRRPDPAPAPERGGSGRRGAVPIPAVVARLRVAGRQPARRHQGPAPALSDSDAGTLWGKGRGQAWAYLPPRLAEGPSRRAQVTAAAATAGRRGHCRPPRQPRGD